MMWRLTATLRLVGLGIYALGLAVLWTVWGALVLVTMLLGAGLRLLRVSLARLERLIATHRHSWRSLVRTHVVRQPSAPAEHADSGDAPASPTLLDLREVDAVERSSPTARE
jgi:hypothetical protein